MQQAIYAELLTIGDEILYGQIVNTNAQWMGVELSKAGIRVKRHTSVADHREEILAALREATSRAHIVLITGGLGPTKDDITKYTLAEYFKSELKESPEALHHLNELLARRGRVLTDLNRTQALQPVKATYIQNKIGTAPGMWFDVEPGLAQLHQAVVVSMPGVPQEMKMMMTDIVLPMLVARFNPPVIVHHIVRTIGIAESMLAERISNWEDALPSHVSLAYLPSFGQVKLRLTGTGSDADKLKTQLAELAEALRPLVGEFIYAYQDEELPVTIGKLLLAEKATLATAESFTGGTIGQLITAISGSSAYYLGGSIAYDNQVKIDALGVPEKLIATHGAVSAEVAEAMAMGIQKATGATYAISTTGIAGPTGATEHKPVGLVYYGLAYPGGVTSVKVQLLTDRTLNIQMGANGALNLLRKKLQGID